MMTDKNGELKAALREKLDEIGRLTDSMKARISGGDADIADDIRELDRLVHDLKDVEGHPAFDRTAYQREYMRKKRKENPDYRPIIEPIRDLPDWRKPPLK